MPSSALAADRALSGRPAAPPEPGFFDGRTADGPAARTPAQQRARRQLGPQGVVAPGDGRGDTALVLRRDGFLTGPSRRPPEAIALDYLRGHPGLFGLDADDVAALTPQREGRFLRGLRRVQLVQTAHGIPSLDTGLRATVDADGRLISVSGAPRPDLGSAPAPAPRLDASAALRRAFELAGERGPVDPLGPGSGAERATAFAGGHNASLTWFVSAAGVRLAWRVLLSADSAHLFDTVLDAEDGSLLMRRNLVRSAGQALAWDRYPGAPLGGTRLGRDFRPWLLPGADELLGPNAWVYADLGDTIYQVSGNGTVTNATPPDNDTVQIRPNADGDWWFEQQLFPLTGSGRSCPKDNGLVGGCSWDFFNTGSRTANRRQAGTQLFYFVNRFHDHLATAPGIGFTAAAGGFEGGDRLHAQVLDGVSRAGFGSPSDDHVNNANMLPMPDGMSPRMQMYLFASDVPVDDGVNTGVNEVNGADDAEIVYHEYTHGMNHRLLCCDSLGLGLIAGPQSGALDEGWADWYAVDFLDANGLMVDGAAAGDVRLGTYENFPLRFQGLDCPPGGGGAACPGSAPSSCADAVAGLPGAGPGGFTYGDFGRICQVDDVNNATGAGAPDGRPDGEVHADGEIWAATLWDLRRALIAAHGRPLGVQRARALVTTGMVLSGGYPDFLDMRDAILAANAALGGGPGDCTLIWGAFAARGMGANASAAGDADTTPVEGFVNPGGPACGAVPAQVTAARPARPARPNLRRAAARIRVSRKGAFAYAFRATAGLRGTAAFRTRRKPIVSGRGRAVKRAHLTLARKSFKVGRSARVVLKLKLSRRHLKILRRNRKLLVRVTITVRSAGGRASAQRNLTLLAPKRKPN